jgi:hypothetical protein
MEFNYHSDIIYIDIDDTLCQRRLSSETYISDFELFELFTKVEGKIWSKGDDF